MPRRTNDVRYRELTHLNGAVVVRTRDLRAHGVSPGTITRRTRPGGPWRPLMPAIVLLHNGPPTRDDMRRAALLHAGPGAVLTGSDALELHGMKRMPPPTGLIHVLVPAGRRRVGAGKLLVERTDRLPVAAPGQWPLPPIERAALDLARRTRDRDVVRAVLAEVVQRGRTTPARLVAELEAGSDRGTALPREVLTAVSDGIRSVAEAEARELLRRSNLPQPMWNARVVDARNGRFIAVADAWFDEFALAWEIDSYEFHLSPADYERTLERRAAMTAVGITVVAHSPKQVVDQGAKVLAALAGNLNQAARRPRPPVIALPAGASGPPTR
jgi:hypothetical protein